MRELPRKLSVGELAELFEGRTRFVELLAEAENPLAHAHEIATTLTDAEKREVLDAHPPIGAGKNLSARSQAEQGSDDDPAVLAELAALNRTYEERFGFRFVVFVNGRPRRAIVPILKERLERSREQELATALDELVSIAEARWRNS
jgi:2-oxo-4-hydroxy-4-carboxy--5-ureidoimidazoline (OHCU) decarboxylase